MSFKENLKTKVELDRLVTDLYATLREPPAQRHVDKSLMKTLLAKTDFTLKKARDLELYVRPLEGETMEILVFDNELAIYHSTIDDVALRKSPDWKEMFSIRNVRRILDDKDVVVCKGKESIRRIYGDALSGLDLSYAENDMAALAADGRRALEERSPEGVEETLKLFSEILGLLAVNLPVLEEDLQALARPKANGGEPTLLEHLILFDASRFWIALRRGTFSPDNEFDLAKIAACIKGEKPPDLEGSTVFQFLADLALKNRERKVAVPP
ncbi:MAG TPA: hypothetical protein VMU60_02945 [Syntrophobacteria bacterium]|nr:hypothetical protein [Syntrophobacteria bacterium]